MPQANLISYTLILLSLKLIEFFPILAKGVILSSVYSGTNENEGFLLILDAKTFSEIARAKFQSPSALTETFDGLFI